MKKALKWLDENFEVFFMSILMGAIALVMFLQCVMRYVFNSSLSWPEEMARYLFIYFVYFGVSYCVRHDTHLSLDLIPSFFPKFEKLHKLIGDVSIFIFSLVLAYGGVIKLQQLVHQTQLSPAMRIPMQFVYFAVELGFILTMIRVVQKYVVLIMDKAKEKALPDNH